MTPSGLSVEVVYALPAHCWSVRLQLPEGATVAEAIAASGLEAEVPALRCDPAALAVYGKPVTPDAVLRDGDRVEILRPLLADPKEARRRRADASRRPR